MLNYQHDATNPNIVNIKIGQMTVAIVEYMPHSDGPQREGAWRFKNWAHDDMFPNCTALHRIADIMFELDTKYPHGHV